MQDTVSGNSVRAIIQNISSSNNSIAGVEVATGVANAFVLLDINNQTANPSVNFGWGSGVTAGMNITNNGASKVVINNGVQVGAPTGSDKGTGTVNAATAYYVNGAQLLPQTAPTVQRFTTGTSQTYTPTAGFARIKVRMSGGGGGGGATVTNAGSVGTDTSFGSWTAIHGNGGGAGGAAGGAGGTGGVNSTGTLIVRFDGSAGQSGFQTNIAGVVPNGGIGGMNAFGGYGRTAGGAAGGAAPANTGGGGGGAGSNAANAGSGGGAGEYVEFFMTAAQVGSSQTYTVGGGGNGGTAGTNAGGNGAAGIIVIEEYYI